MKIPVFLITPILITFLSSCTSHTGKERKDIHTREYNGAYTGEYLNHIAFPLGGIGAGMVCLEGTGAFSRFLTANWNNLHEEIMMFAAISVKGTENGAKVLEGQVPSWKYSKGDQGHNSWGLPRFKNAEFTARFPFANISLHDPDIPLDATLVGWSPFIPADADNSSLPVGAVEYSFKNTGTTVIEAVFSFHSANFVKMREGKNAILPVNNGFILSQENTETTPPQGEHFAIYTDQPSTVVDHCWFRGGWFDALTMVWKNVKEINLNARMPVEKDAPGASLYVPLQIAPGTEETVRLMFSWHVPNTTLRFGRDPEGTPPCDPSADCYHQPWYSGEFGTVSEIANYWDSNYIDLKNRSTLFSEAFYNSSLPPEVLEAVAANLTILKSPTVLRQPDGKMWAWEGAYCCHGSCTHVWNYAQAIPHLFPVLERSLRDTEFNESLNSTGHQAFRASLPIRPISYGTDIFGRYDFHAAADGQLGGIMKVYREWRISGDNEWMKNIFPKVRLSMDYCIKTWDPRNKGVVEEPHHNTYDIEFWGPNGMITSFYLGALNAISEMGQFLGEDVSRYRKLYQQGKQFMESELYNGEYFIHKIQWEGLDAPDPVEASKATLRTNYSEEALSLMKKEGPKYQYGDGCLSDGVLGCWIALVCGLDNPVDNEKTKNHLLSVYKYNLKHDLSNHANPQRSIYALGNEGGLLLCTWPKGGELSLPFVYSDEVWTGIEYQVASHLIFMGEVEKGLDIVRTCRARYDGRKRNPFSEVECGIWYARAMASYALLEALTGVRYDAVDQTLFIDSKIGDFTSFLSTETGFGNVGLKKGKPFLNIVHGFLDVKKVIVSGEEQQLAKHTLGAVSLIEILSTTKDAKDNTKDTKCCRLEIYTSRPLCVI